MKINGNGFHEAEPVKLTPLSRDTLDFEVREGDRLCAAVEDAYHAVLFASVMGDETQVVYHGEAICTEGRERYAGSDPNRGNEITALLDKRISAIDKRAQKWGRD